MLDGQGLHLQIRGATNASWILRFVSPVSRRTREMGLGSISQVTLAEARAKAAEIRVMVAKGQDPIEAQKETTGFLKNPVVGGASSITFGIAAERFWEAQQGRWRNAKVRLSWVPFMRQHCARLWQVPVDQVDQQMMVMVLQSIWASHNVTARRAMHRCGQVLDFSRVMGWRSGANPARFKGELEYALPKRPANVNVKHLSAVPLAELPALMSRLESIPGTAPLAARFTILTASRPGEVLGATWSEIDGDVWRIPGARYKTNKEHIVPLSVAAMDVLAECPRLEGNPYVFCSPTKPRTPLSGMTCISLLRRIGVTETLHGTSRSTFSDWAHNETEFPHEVIEMALGHTQSGVVRAYWRKYPVDKIRALLEAWAERCCTQTLAAVAAE